MGLLGLSGAKKMRGEWSSIIEKPLSFLPLEDFTLFYQLNGAQKKVGTERYPKQLMFMSKMRKK